MRFQPSRLTEQCWGQTGAQAHQRESHSVLGETNLEDQLGKVPREGRG